jgi:hypothetical protein
MKLDTFFEEELNLADNHVCRPFWPSFCKHPGHTGARVFGRVSRTNSLTWCGVKMNATGPPADSAIKHSNVKLVQRGLTIKQMNAVIPISVI